MLKLYFGSTTSVISTALILVFCVFFGFVTARRSGFKDGNGTAAMVIPTGHWIMNLLCVMGGLGFVTGIVALIIRKQNFWQIGFFILSGLIIAKILLTEGFRISKILK